MNRGDIIDSLRNSTNPTIEGRISEAEELACKPCRERIACLMRNQMCVDLLRAVTLEWKGTVMQC